MAPRNQRDNNGGSYHLALFLTSPINPAARITSFPALLIQESQRHSEAISGGFLVVFQHKIFYPSISLALIDIALLNDPLQNFMSVVSQGLK